MTKGLFALWMVLAICSAARPASAQLGPAPKGRCQFVLDENPTGRVNAIKLPSGQYNSYFGGGIVARCPSQRLVLRSDSLETYGDEGRYFFVGHVDYNEPRLQLKADYLTYFQRDDRLLAYLNVDATLPSGSKLVGPHLEVFKEIPNVRQQHGSSTGRPTITIIEKDSTGKPQPPVTVTGNTIWFVGDSTVASSGQVVVIRPELNASGDSLFLDGNTGLLRLMRTPRVLGTKGRVFTLVGETIDVLSRQRRLERVLAKVNAEATSQDLDLKSDTIDLRITDDVLQRAIAWGKSRARAVSPQRTLLADSIDVLMPGQRLREMHALRNAVAEGAPDTTRFRTLENDRLTGDTIVAYFDTTAAPVGDTTSKPRIQRLVSTGSATSLQHLPPRDTALRAPAIVYVTGTAINVTFDTGAVQRVQVRNQQLASGIYLEPAPDSARATRGSPAPGRSPAASGPAAVPSSPIAPRPTAPPAKAPAPGPTPGPAQAPAQVSEPKPAAGAAPGPTVAPTKPR
jgi:lipopolysaccharide export system protein LptA